MSRWILDTDHVSLLLAGHPQVSRVILHYSQNAKLVLVEVLDFRRLMSNEAIAELLASE
jgi:hypothetical protein